MSTNLIAGREPAASNAHTSNQHAISPPQLSLEALDSMDWQLWALAILLISVMGVGLLSFMFPAVFWFRETLPVKAPERAFYGFSTLLTLSLVYLIQKQSRLRQLKRELLRAQEALLVAERQAEIESFETLPSISQFRDTLAMEYRRASTAEVSLAVLLFSAPSATLEALGRLTRLLRSMLRQGETLYRISETTVAALMPGMHLEQAVSFAAQIETASELHPESRITSYPEDVSSLTELEVKLRGPHTQHPQPSDNPPV